MSRENVEVVRGSFEAFNRGGIPAVVSGGFWSPEIVFDPTPTGMPGIGVYRGYDEIAAFFEEDWFATFPFEEWGIEVDDLVDDCVLLLAQDLVRALEEDEGDAELVGSVGVGGDALALGLDHLFDGDVGRQFHELPLARAEHLLSVAGSGLGLARDDVPDEPRRVRRAQGRAASRDGVLGNQGLGPVDHFLRRSVLHGARRSLEGSRRQVVRRG